MNGVLLYDSLEFRKKNTMFKNPFTTKQIKVLLTIFGRVSNGESILILYLLVFCKRLAWYLHYLQVLL